MEHLQYVRQVDNPRRQQDLRPAGLTRLALPVPPLEGLEQRIAHLLGQAEPGRELVRRIPVIRQHLLGDPGSLAEERHTQPDPLGQRPSRAQVLGHVHVRREPGHVVLPEVPLQRKIISEPLRLFVRVDVTADPGDQRDVVEDCAILVAQAQSLTQSERNQALPQRVLHRLTQAKISTKRQHREQLSQSDACAGRCPHNGLIVEGTRLSQPACAGPATPSAGWSPPATGGQRELRCRRTAQPASAANS